MSSRTLSELAIEFGLSEALVGEVVRDALAHASSRVSESSTEKRVNSRTLVQEDGADVEGPPGPDSDSHSGLSESRVSMDSRYEDLGPIGFGGMGEVRRVMDRRLGRTLAMKIIRKPVLSRPGLLERFLEEAQATAQLEHPGIVPVHDLGELPDGRLWFTMKEIRGRTLDKVIAEVGQVEEGEVGTTGWTFRGLVDAFRRVCEAVAFAHSRGVLHRDLKPANVMVGEHGEVLVLDWGLTKVIAAPAGKTPGATRAVTTDRSREGAHLTQEGEVAGTPAYMAPEQARGQIDRLGECTDVYALGAILYQVLSGRPPYGGSTAKGVLRQVLAGPPAPLDASRGAAVTFGFGDLDTEPVSGSPMPAELVDACERAMAREPVDRLGSAAELAAEMASWLEGARQREQARAVVARANAREPEAALLRAEAALLRAEGADRLAAVEEWRLEEDKAEGWEKQDAATELDRRADLLVLEAESLLRGSLVHAPRLPEAHAALAVHYRAQHEAAEAMGGDAVRLGRLLQDHLDLLPADHLGRSDHGVYLRGDGSLTLVTDPPGAEVALHCYERYRRRLVPRFVRSLGQTPLVSLSLPRGSYLCVVTHPDRAPVRYPVFIERQAHWHGVPPGEEHPRPLLLPPGPELGPEDCYVPAGWFWSGGGSLSERTLPRQRSWCEGWVVRRFPVTNREYIVFLDDLVKRGQLEEALRFVPREKGGSRGGHGQQIYGFDGQQFSLGADADGHVWSPDWPVCMVDWFGALAYAAWEGERSGLPWVLPPERIWEKAARGVDGRAYPWGDTFDPGWAWTQGSHRDAPLPCAVGHRKEDESPYGVRDVAGNMSDWCAGDALEAGARAGGTIGTRKPYRGGTWTGTEAYCQAAIRRIAPAEERHGGIGFRLARRWPC